ncbi:envelope stress response membrane protein PspC [Thalassotalea euphylliae]|uniref:Envelope stress response membrane protein PspC n=1 Tax=Thalassotalea euphylliae TaxID=1655234 RepID=A0A3E0U6B5_9GAMM|nr:envelope stress response membrane protein PspC [Thalassotalea euphylliae]REL32349.1 envelope stress response membrane protein PspC [Thalassotalea euphylliae]
MSVKRRGELYRIPSQGKIAGVCAGLADYFGWETWLVRILIVSGVLFGMPWLVFLYIAAWFILDKKPATATSPIADQHTPAPASATQVEGYEPVADIQSEPIKVKARIWQAGEPPKQAFHDIRRKYMAMERQLRLMERYVTSPEFTVSREINKL